MKQSVAKYVRWMVMTLGTAAFLWLMPWSFLAGSVMARVDLSRGQAQMLISGAPNPWNRCDVADLHQNGDLEMQSTVLCGISTVVAHYEQGYNTTMHDALRARDGFDARQGGPHRASLEWGGDRPRPRQ